MIKALSTTILFIFLSYISFSQNKHLNLQNINLELATSIRLVKEPASKLTQLIVDNEVVSKLNYHNGEMVAFFENDTLDGIPEKFNIGITLIKNNYGKVVGMSKKYKNGYLVGVGERVFKIERLYQNNQFKLWELQDGKSEVEHLPKIIKVKNFGSEMEIFHNLENLPTSVLPFLINTKKTDKKVNARILAGCLTTGFLIALKVLIIATK